MNQKMLDFHKSVESILSESQFNRSLFFGEDGIVVQSHGVESIADLKLICLANDIKMSSIAGHSWSLLTEF